MPAIVPIADPTMIDEQDFRKSLGNALFTQKSRATKTGYAFLVETEAVHQKRMNIDTAVLPTASTEPIGAALTGTSYRIFEKQYDAYETARNHQCAPSEVPN